MGALHGAKALHSLTGLEMGDIVDWLRGMARERGTSTPTVDVDCSNVCFKLGKSIRGLSSHLMKWANSGICVVPICDGKERPVCKQATNKRRADREKNRIKASILRKDLRELRRRLYCDLNDRQEILKEIAEKEKSCKSAETSSKNAIPADLDTKLIAELKQSSAHSKGESRGYVGQVLTAEFQADSLIMGRSVRGESLLVESSDADIPLIGGDHLVALKEFTKKAGWELVCTSAKPLEEVLEFVTENAKKRIKLTVAKHPIFQGVEDRKTRALMCLYLGCDVYVKGMAGVGAKTLEDIINIKYQAFRERCPRASLFAYLKKYLHKHTPRFDNDVVHTYIRALVYEPTNIAPESHESNEVTINNEEVNVEHIRTYLDQPPTKLPEYLAEFAAADTELKGGPAMEVCRGVGNSTHPFLSADGFEKCKSCSEVVCKHCQASIDNHTYCLLCYAQESLIPLPGEDSGKPVCQMRDELAEKYNFDSVDDLTIEEVEDFYSVREVVNARANEMADAVPFPLHPAGDMDSELHWTSLMDIDFGDGGAFIADPSLDPEHLPGILEFFASLVRFKIITRTDHIKDPVIYDAMPEMFIQFAEKSRVDSGFRLLARTIRHAFDSRLPPMDDCIAKLIMDKNGDVGVRLCSEIPASMKKDVYETEIAATSKNLLCCKCTCHCGSQDSERIACVHTPVRLYALSLLMHEDLAEHILLELAARVSGSPNDGNCPTEKDGAAATWDMSLWTKENTLVMKENAIILMHAAGESLSCEEAESKALPDLLQHFVVGTERRKLWKERLPAKSSELCPVSDMLFMSTAKRAKMSINRDAKQRAKPAVSAIAKDDDSDIHAEDKDVIITEENSEGASPAFNPDYKKIWSLMDAAGCDNEDCKFAGIRMLASRANTQLNELSAYQKNAINKESKREWSMLQQETKRRTVNLSLSQRNNLKRNSSTISPRSLQTSPTKISFGQEEPCAVTPSPTLTRRSGRDSRRRKYPSLPMCQNVATNEQSVQQEEQNQGKRKTLRVRRSEKLSKQWTRPIPQQKKKKRMVPQDKYQKCHSHGCPVTNHTRGFCHIKYHKVPKYPSDLNSKNPRKTAVVNRQGKIFQRREILRRMRIDEDCMEEWIYCCERHTFKEETQYIDVEYNGKSWSQGFKMILPIDIGPKSTMNESSQSLGLGSDRQLQRVLVESQEIMKKGFVSGALILEQPKKKRRKAKPKSVTEELQVAQAERDMYKARAEAAHADAVRATLALNQTIEQMADDQHVPINPKVKRAANLEHHIEDPSMPTPEGLFFRARVHKPKAEPFHRTADDSPLVDLDTPDDEVRRRTGFPTMSALLTYIFIICNGDVNEILQRCTSLTWFEHFFVHFEYKWGRTLSRVWDVEQVYGPNRHYFVKLFDSKYRVERRARQSWPVYASYKEDIEIRKDKWNLKYPNERIVMWDMTDVKAYGFSDADLQRLTYSKYYNGNCFKGGVFTQLCGWIGTGDLWPGAVSDSDYNRREGYLNRQQDFADQDLIDVEGAGSCTVVPFTNIYDKGYRAKMIAWKTGKQHVRQPIWAESDKRFGRKETLLSADVATDRAGNERGVNVCKRAWYISRGFTPNMSPKRMNDAWTTWSFQSNFMFNPVL